VGCKGCVGFQPDREVSGGGGPCCAGHWPSISLGLTFLIYKKESWVFPCFSMPKEENVMCVR
jgi:hypothetical protein